MGYEARYYVVDKTNMDGDSSFAGGRKYAKTIAVFDLCKDDNITRITREYPVTEYYVFAEDENTPIIVDGYGKELREIPLKDMIKLVEETIQKDSYYRRRIPLLNLLKSFDNDEWKRVAVLHFGH